MTASVPRLNVASVLAQLSRASAGVQQSAQFAAELARLLMDATGAHGVRLRLDGAESGQMLAELGRGLALCDERLIEQARTAGGRASSGLHDALIAGGLMLDVVGGDAGAIGELLPLLPLLGLAFEGVQARETRRGAGREQETVMRLVRRMGGSLDLGQLLTATAETAAGALGFERAFVGLLRAEPGEQAAHQTGDVFTHGFDEHFSGGVGVGPESFERLFTRGEAIVYQRAQDSGSPMGAGLAELNPETAVIAPLAARGRPLGLLYSGHPPRRAADRKRPVAGAGRWPSRPA